MRQLSSRFVLPLLVVFYSLNFMDRSVMSVVSEAMRLELGLNDAQVGFSHSLLLISLIFLIIPCSVCNDLFGRRRMLALAAGMWTLGMGCMGFAASFQQVLIGRLLGGFNDAFAGSGGSSWLSQLYPPQRRSRILGLYHMSAPLGMALGTLLGGILLALTGSWRISFLCFVIPGILMSVLIPRLPDSQTMASIKTYGTGLAQVMHSRTILLTGCAVGCFCIIKFAYQAWLPTLLIRTYEISSGLVGGLFAAMLLAGALGPYLGGALADYWQARANNGRPKAAATCLLVMIASKFVFYSLIGKVSLPLICAIGFCDGVLTMTPLPIYFSMVQDVVGPSYKNLAIGGMGALSFLAGGAWGPLVVGVLSDIFGGGAEGLRLALLTLLTFGLVAAALFLAQLRSYSRECEAAQLQS